jgi:hypothetical protein
MSPAAIIALIKDVVIVGAIGLVAYFLVSYGKDIVKVSDMKAIEAQIQKNAQQQEKWQKDATDADAKRSSEMYAVATTIAGQHGPIIVRQPSACPVSNDPAKAGSEPAKGGGADPGSGTDIRPAVNAFELKYEQSLADCRDALAKWP